MPSDGNMQRGTGCSKCKRQFRSRSWAAGPYDAWDAAERDQGYDADAAEWRAKLAPEDLAGYLITRGRKLVDQGKHADAEPLLRECLKIRKEVLAEDHWLIFNTMSVLGAALAGQEKLAEAEPLLIEGYEQMKPPPAAISRKQEALERIASLYDAWHAADPAEGYDVKAVEWRAKLAEWQVITLPAAGNEVPPTVRAASQPVASPE